MLIVVRSVTASVSGLRRITFSVDNGSNFFTANGDYSTIGSDGTVTLGTGISHSTNSLASRTVVAHVLNMKGVTKIVDMHNGSGTRTMFVASPLDINAIRLDNSVSGVATGNLTSGIMEVYVR
jgi:hypothetical protein